MAVHAPQQHDPVTRPTEIDRRALTLWPRLDRRALARCRHDADAVARLVSRRTNLPPDSIRALLTAPSISAEDGERWFG